jgi:hypothetical protein
MVKFLGTANAFLAENVGERQADEMARMKFAERRKNLFAERQVQ